MKTGASGVAHEDGEHRKRDVLEGASLAVEKLEHVKPVLLNERNGVFGWEAGAEAVNRRLADFRREIAEEARQDKILGLAQGQVRVI